MWSLVVLFLVASWLRCSSATFTSSYRYKSLPRGQQSAVLLLCRGGSMTQPDNILDSEDTVVASVMAEDDNEDSSSMENLNLTSHTELSKTVVSAINNNSNPSERFTSEEYDVVSHKDDLEGSIHNNNVEIDLAEEKESEARAQAMSLRLQGKEVHDRGDFHEAAEIFLQASHILIDELRLETENQSNYNNITSESTSISNSNLNEIAEEYATCRLHEALCRLKEEEFELCIAACSDVLNEPTPPPLTVLSLEDENHTKTSNTVSAISGAVISGAARARAFHRRAKAKLGLDDTVGALADARSAAFLGDRKAVALYGRLLRSQDGSSSWDGSSTGMMETLLPSWLGQSDTTGSSSSSSSMASALLESLMSKSSTDSSNPTIMNGLINGLLSNSRDPMDVNSNNNNGGLAQSVLKSLSKRLEDTSTQETICRYLQSAKVEQLQQWAGLAGINVSLDQATKWIQLCHSVTPRSIARTIGTTKAVVYVISLLRKTLRVLRKYKSIIILIAILGWIKSAILRPIPIHHNKAMKRT